MSARKRVYDSTSYDVSVKKKMYVFGRTKADAAATVKNLKANEAPERPVSTKIVEDKEGGYRTYYWWPK